MTDESSSYSCWISLFINQNSQILRRRTLVRASRNDWGYNLCYAVEEYIKTGPFTPHHRLKVARSGPVFLLDIFEFYRMNEFI